MFELKLPAALAAGMFGSVKKASGEGACDGTQTNEYLTNETLWAADRKGQSCHPEKQSNSSAQDFALAAKSVRIYFSGEEYGTLPKVNFEYTGFGYGSAARLNCNKTDMKFQ